MQLDISKFDMSRIKSPKENSNREGTNIEVDYRCRIMLTFSVNAIIRWLRTSSCG